MLYWVLTCVPACQADPQGTHMASNPLHRPVQQVPSLFHLRPDALAARSTALELHEGLGSGL